MDFYVMHRNLLIRTLIGLVTMALLAAGCNGGNRGAVLSPGKVSAGAFTLTVLDDTLVPGGEYCSAGLDISADGPETVVAVRIDGATGLKACYFTLDYDATELTPAGASASGLLDGGTTLEVSDLAQAGTVTHGQVLADWDDRSGFTGSGTVATVHFRPGPFTGGRTASTPPDSSRDIPELEIDETVSTLSWRYACTGDYDQNSLVSVSDLTPLGRFYEQSVPAGTDSAQWVVDGNGDGFITVSDITPIGRNYDQGITEYAVFYTEDESQRPEAGGGSPSPLFEVSFSAADGEPGSERLSFSEHQPLAAPNGWFWVRSVHQGSLGPASGSIKVGGGGNPENQPPTASLTAGPVNGLSPQTVQFDASGSTDSDGAIVSFEWDWDLADETWDWEDTGFNSTTEHVYHTPGSYTAMLRVTDNFGVVATDQVDLVIARGANQAPVAVITADPQDTHEWHRIKLDASASFDWDGDIVSFLWDIGEGQYVVGSNSYPEVEVRYSSPGEYYPAITLTDDSGGHTTESIAITIVENLPPVAFLDASPTSGTAPLTVSLDPAGTYDPEGELEELMLNDGDWYRRIPPSGVEIEDLLAPFEQTFFLSGTYEFLFWAEDEHHKGSNEISTTVQVDGWDTESWEIDPGLHLGEDMDMIVHNGRLMIVADARVDGESNLYCIRASDDTGRNWLPPVMIDTGMGIIAGTADLELIDGLPALTYRHTTDDCLYYARALDDDGQAWGDKVMIDSGFGMAAGYSSLKTIAGHPAVAYGDGTRVKYTRALDPTGGEWREPVVIEEGIQAGFPSALLEVEGLPAVSYTVASTYLRYVLLPDVNGAGAGEVQTIPGSEESYGLPIQMLMVEGMPAILCHGRYSRALDIQGNEWSEQQIPGQGYWLALVYGNQLIEFRDELVYFERSGNLIMNISRDDFGTDWYDYQPFDDRYDVTLHMSVVENGDSLFLVYRKDEFAAPLTCIRIY